MFWRFQHRFKACPNPVNCGQTWPSFSVLSKIHTGLCCLPYLIWQPQASITMSSLDSRGIFAPLTRCNNKVVLTAVWSCSEARTTAAVFRKKHLKDIRRLGSDFKWKLNQGVKTLWKHSAAARTIHWVCWRVTGSKSNYRCEDLPCKHNLWLRQGSGDSLLLVEFVCPRSRR